MNQQVSSAGRCAEPHVSRAQRRPRTRRNADLRCAAAHGFQGVEPARAVPALVDAQVGTGVSLVSCDMDVRTGGKYRLEFGAGGSDTMAFYGKYLEVVPNERIVWTNDEGEEGAITTVTFEDQGGKTLLSFHEIYPSKEALEEATAGLGGRALPEQLEQLADRFRAWKRRVSKAKRPANISRSVPLASPLAESSQPTGEIGPGDGFVARRRRRGDVDVGRVRRDPRRRFGRLSGLRRLGRRRRWRRRRFVGMLLHEELSFADRTRLRTGVASCIGLPNGPRLL